jgi:hypothetical protein
MKLQKILKFTLVLTIVGGTLLSAFLTFMNWPSGVDYELAKTPVSKLAELESFINENKDLEKDVYLSNAYEPREELYGALLAIQQDKTKQAVDILTPLAEQGDSDAMFWLGEITYSSSIFSNGGEWFVKAAQLGNPYAAIKLSPEFNISYDCERWLSTYCDEKWGSIALRLLNDKAKKGDVKAEYAALYYTRFSNRDADYFDSFIQVVEKGMEHNYFTPLRNLVYMYQTRTSLSPFNNDVIPLNKMEKELLARLLFIGANNNDLPSINLINERYLNFLPEQKAFDQVVQQNLPLIDSNYAFIAFDYFIREYKQTTNNRLSLVKGYAYALLFDKYIGDLGPYGTYRGIYESEVSDNNIGSLTPEEIESATTIFESISRASKPSIFIDEVQGVRALLTRSF